MMHYKKFILRFVASLILIGFISNNSVFAQGEALFKANCANCHKPDADFTGPALKGVREKEPSKEWAYKWVKNSPVVRETDPYGKALFAKWNKTPMTAFSNLKDEEIKSILDYADAYQPPAAAKGGNNEPAQDNSFLFGILTLILAIVAFILLQVNSNLRKLSDDKDGIFRGEPVPFYRNKTYLMAGVLLLAAVGMYLTMSGWNGKGGGMNLGRQQNYQPEQPIFYSHKVHAGTNQISCLYCHGGAQDSKQASIPSVNVCMNCHMAVKEYKGEAITREDGTAVNGTAEIQKLYAYAGWNPATKSYNPDNNKDGIPDGASPIQWIKIHNLPDHVYFNHSQHIKVGKQQCQTCHGNIQEMAEVKQFADLSMGWCVNCHRESKVDFYNRADSTGNKFYSIYEKFHTDIKNHKMDSVTVENIGGTECQKCHY
ncbi:MAG: c-type cytochrome [Ferruginibacter sp.]|nr:c-type cytochrome [Ferruginibacter sp.]